MTLPHLPSRTLLAGVACALALLLAGPPAISAQQKAGQAAAAINGNDADAAAIKLVLDTYTQAWNRSDPHTLAQLFSDDADYTVVGGGNTHGREALEKMFGNNFTGNMKNSTRTDDIRRMRFLAPNIASIDDYWVLNIQGRDMPSQGYYNWILMKQADGRWLIVLHHAAQFQPSQSGRAN